MVTSTPGSVSITAQPRGNSHSGAVAPELHDPRSPVLTPTAGMAYVQYPGYGISTITVEKCPGDLADLRKMFGGFAGLHRIIFDKLGTCRLRFDSPQNAGQAMETINAYMGMNARFCASNHVSPPPAAALRASSRVLYFKVPTWVSLQQLSKILGVYDGLLRVWACEVHLRPQAIFVDNESARRMMDDLNATTTIQAIPFDGRCDCEACNGQHNPTSRQHGRLNVNASEFYPSGLLTDSGSGALVRHQPQQSSRVREGDTLWSMLTESRATHSPDSHSEEAENWSRRIMSLMSDILRRKVDVSVNQPEGTNVIHLLNCPLDLVELFFAGLEGYRGVTGVGHNGDLYVRFANVVSASRALRTVKTLLALGRLGGLGNAEKGEMKVMHADNIDAAHLETDTRKEADGSETVKGESHENVSKATRAAVEAAELESTLSPKQCKKLQKKLEVQRERERKMAALTADFASKLQAKSNEATNLQAKVEELEKQIDGNSNTKLSTVQKALEELANKHATDRSEFVKQQRDYAKLVEQHEKHERELRPTIANLTREKDDAMSLLERRDQEIMDLKDPTKNGTVLALKKDMEALQETFHAELNQAQQELEDLKASLPASQKEADAAKKQRDDTIREMAQRDEAIQVIQNELEKALVTIQRFESSMMEREEGLQKAEQEILRLSAEADAAQKQRDETIREIAHRNEANQVIQDELNKALVTIQLRDESLQSAERETLRLIDELAAAKEGIAAINRNMEAVVAQAGAEAAEAMKVSDDLKAVEMQEALADMRAEVARAQETAGLVVVASEAKALEDKQAIETNANLLRESIENEVMGALIGPLVSTLIDTCFVLAKTAPPIDENEAGDREGGRVGRVIGLTVPAALGCRDSIVGDGDEEGSEAFRLERVLVW
ncbi:hypothetical protein HK104_011206 [Borealophlyctis nickersoniae]|nr:hypothetical protein HK104_011206 [Borealophlyctis nickersoniae]